MQLIYNTNKNTIRRGAGVVERDDLESRCVHSGHRGFESHPLRIPSVI